MKPFFFGHFRNSLITDAKVNLTGGRLWVPVEGGRPKVLFDYTQYGLIRTILISKALKRPNTKPSRIYEKETLSSFAVTGRELDINHF